MGWQCAILGQLVGTTTIQDGCRDTDKLQNVFIFTLHHARTIFVYVHACFKVRGIQWNRLNNVRLCPRDQNSTWPPFPPTIAKIEHNLIVFCYINMILFCTFLCFIISGLKRKYFNWCPPKKTEEYLKWRHFSQTDASATILCLLLRFSIRART